MTPFKPFKQNSQVYVYSGDKETVPIAAEADVTLLRFCERRYSAMDEITEMADHCSSLAL